MGDRFGRVITSGRWRLNQFLLREYPKSKFAQDVLLRHRELQQNNLGTRLADEKVSGFSEAVSGSTHSASAGILEELSLLQNNSAADASRPWRKTGPPETGNGANGKKETPGMRKRKNSLRGIERIPTVKNDQCGRRRGLDARHHRLEDAVQYLSETNTNPTASI